MPMTINFVDASEGANIETYGWDFGDGDTSTLEDPSHVYADPLAAAYTVTHYVTNSKGMGSVSKVITVPTFTLQAGLTVEMNANPLLNVVTAGDFIASAGDCGSFLISRTVGGTYTSTITFECADRPTLQLYVKGVQTGTGLTRVIPVTLTINDTGGVCP